MRQVGKSLEFRPVDIIGERDVAVGDAARWVSAVEVDDLLRIRIGEWAEKDAIHQAEDGGVRADTEPESYDSYRGETFVL